MSVLNEALIGRVADPNLSAPAAYSSDIEYLGGYFWKWYMDHENDRIATVKFLFINVTVQVHHLRTLFLLLFGPQING